MAGEDHSPFVGEEGLGEGVDGLDVEVVARFVEDEDVEGPEEQAGHAEPGPFTAGENLHLLLHRLAAEEHGAGEVEDLLLFRADHRRPFEVAENGVGFGQARVDMLRVDPDLAAVAPLHLPFDRLERIDDRPQEGRLSLTVVADDRGP